MDRPPPTVPRSGFPARLARSGTPAPPRPALVIASPWAYHPGCGIGGGVLCFELLRRLSGRFDIHFVAFDAVPHDLEAGRRSLAEHCASVTLLPAPADRGRLADRAGQLTQVLTRAPREVRSARSVGMAEEIARLVRTHAPAAVVLQFPQMAQYADAATGALVVVDVQDAATISRWREFRTARGGAKRLARFVAWLAWARYESHWYGRADTLLALSETDLGLLRGFLPEIPSLMSPVAVQPRPARRPRDGSRVGFIGNADHAPNRDALAWLVAEIWPRVRAHHPDAELHVAGPGTAALLGGEGADGVAPGRAERGAPGRADGITPRRADGITPGRADGIVARGFVDSLDDFYAGMQLAVVPYRFGGGTKIKTLDAMARGCPVVATPVGAEGLRVTAGLELRVAEGTGAFADAISGLLRDPAEREALGAAGQAHVARHFGWETKVEGLTALFEGLAARQSPEAAAQPS